MAFLVKVPLSILIVTFCTGPSNAHLEVASHIAATVIGDLPPKTHGLSWAGVRNWAVAVILPRSAVRLL